MPAPLPRLLVPVVLACAVGCDAEPSAVDMTGTEAPPPPPAPAAFDPANCGTIAGRVTWPGPLPAVQGFVYGVPKEPGKFDIRMMPNPNRPDIDADTRAVAGAVVFLRGVNPAAAKPWDHPPVRVELKDRQIVVKQGDRPAGRVGFVRRGDKVTAASIEPVFHVLRARGVEFFSLTFPDPDRPLTRALDKAGRVELSSGAGYYWASADLFVDDHPYSALTDRDGRFTLEQVPAGPVELAVWLPGWAVGRQERDPESGMVVRMTYGPPTEAGRRVTVERGRSAVVDVTIP